ncbi:unnamed protein product [Eruca vesicaria subsp. sativa]|uniref:Phorbol-ester/DAG-type domain-containing protein n=1 Tax=Eruca vesicaria subsp. sativa TaxID=29727 RepID=A0ABC8LJA8_ERUVS|nr:unnamed protein product [Eruca vesicaria subsp. sativa]
MEVLDKVYSTYETRGLKCAACNLGANYCSDGYRCFRSGLFFHKECANSKQEVFNPYHTQHTLKIKLVSEIEDDHGECKLCRGKLPKMYYYCSICDFEIDLICAKKSVIEMIQDTETHEHPLYLVPDMTMFSCHICKLVDDRFPYKCHLCDLSFHKDCAESPPEINYSCHPYHPLIRLTCVPSYTNGKCCLCGSKLHIVFYHCSICNFSVDLDCVKSPPCVTLFDPKAHAHQLTLLSQRAFVCNACGMTDDPNPYVCLQCNFMIHRSCINIPQIIKINRHADRIRYNQRLNVGDWKCGVCQKDILWTCGAYSCLKCPGLAFHVKCATKVGIWDGVEHEDIFEDTTDLNSHEAIKEGVIKHFSHKKHTIKLKEGIDANDECMWCNICTYPIFSSPFYDCMECDEFSIHQKCAYLPKKIKDSFYMLPLTLLPNKINGLYICNACQNFFRGFVYQSDDHHVSLDVRCGSISEPFVHESHPHSLYINYSTGDKSCNACGNNAITVLSCEECEFVLDIKCSTLPKMVKHKNDKDHFLYLCYGEKTTEQYWCEVCEEDLNPNKWFYSCDYCGITFHIKCTLGDFIWIKPGNEDIRFSVIPNNHINRLICDGCKSRCKFASILKFFEKYTICSLQCFNNKRS